MQGQNDLLLQTLDRHEPHAWPGRGLADAAEGCPPHLRKSHGIIGAIPQVNRAGLLTVSTDGRKLPLAINKARRQGRRRGNAAEVR